MRLILIKYYPEGKRSMLPRERVLAALRRRVPDKVPREMSFTPPMLEEFHRRTGATDPADHFDFETRRVELAPTRKEVDFTPYIGALPSDGWVNEWGIGHVPGSVYPYHDYVHPLENISSVEELKAFPFPDVSADYRYEGVAKEVTGWHQRGYAVQAGIPHYSGTLFECAWLLRGMENLLMDFLVNQELAAALLDALTASGIDSATRLAGAGIDILRTGDDVGMQRRMMMSPKLWRKWLKPRLSEIISAAKKVNPELLVFYHSDGNIEPIIAELIEIGVDILNPVQPECMDPARLKREYGKDLSFWGTMGTQTTMPFGTPEEVKAVVRERIETVGAGGGLLLAPTHVIEPDVAWENVLAFFEAVEEYGRSAK
jgi:uroporphyrinogen decarboxylase